MLSVLVVASLMAASPAAAVDVDEVAAAVRATNFTPDEFLAAFDNAELSGLGPIGAPPSITGNAEVDARIRGIGEGRGYKRRAQANVGLVAVDGRQLQAGAAAAWESLQAAANAAGHSLQLTSAYRSQSSQVGIFLSRLGGTSDGSIDTVLRTVAVPGYSKHHTGYAVDVRSASASGFAFRNSGTYQWLAADNFANAKLHGWIPSYPEGSSPVGPVPEPWEFVWIGTENILCAKFAPNADTPFCDTTGSTFADDIDWLVDEAITTGCRPGRFCEDRTITRAETATMLWRLAGEPPADGNGEVVVPFTDLRADAFYEDAVAWLVAEELTTGTTPTTFSPDRPLTRAEFVTFLWRYLASPEATNLAPGFGDIDDTSFAFGAVAWAAEVGVTTGTTPTTFDPDGNATRGQAAAFFRRTSLLEPVPEPEPEPEPAPA
ncbi:MAG: S-layer homology domain-containing protein [Acidimicrobiales bacterium]